MVLPILHLNGYKIANPTVLARIPERELFDLMRGYAPPVSSPAVSMGKTPSRCTSGLATTLDIVLNQIADI